MGMIELGPRDGIKKLYRTPANRRLKYLALAAICASILLMLATIILMDGISAKGLLIMRGCAGLCALLFIVLYGTLVYRVNRELIKRK